MDNNLPTTPASTSTNLPKIVSSRSLLDIRRTCPRYRDLPAKTRMAWLTEQIIYANAINHQKPDPKMLVVDTAALDEAMVRDSVIGDFTQPEIAFAVLHGALGEYGDFYGLTARTFLTFFREFCRTDIKYYATMTEKKAAEPDRGSWVLERMEHHRRQVEAERALLEAAEEEDEKPIDRAALAQTIINASKNNH